VPRRLLRRAQLLARQPARFVLLELLLELRDPLQAEIAARSEAELGASSGRGAGEVRASSWRDAAEVRPRLHLLHRGPFRLPVRQAQLGHLHAPRARELASCGRSIEIDHAEAAQARR